MNEEQIKKALRCSKEDLIEWLMEMYQNERRLKDIIKKYEEVCNTTCRNETREIKSMGVKTVKYFQRIHYVNINGKSFEYSDYEK